MPLQTLLKIASLLNQHHITWGVGGSMMLYLRGLTTEVNDIDIMVSINDVHKVDELLCRCGHKKAFEPSSTYQTQYFYEYVIDGCDIDVMAGLSIRVNDKDYAYTFNEKTPLDFMSKDVCELPLMLLEDWLLLYLLMPDRARKIVMIENYLSQHGSSHRERLEAVLINDYPDAVKARISVLLSD